MGFGESVKINLKEYVKVLVKVDDTAEQLSKLIKDEKLLAPVTCFVGPKTGDGEILISYKKKVGKEQLKGILKFSENGELKDLLTDETVKQVSKSFAKLFIAGLFGEKELTVALDKSSLMLLGGIMAAKGCYDSKSATPCIKNEPAGVSAKLQSQPVVSGDSIETENICMIALIDDIILNATNPKDINEKANVFASLLKFANNDESKNAVLKTELKSLLATTSAAKTYAQKNANVSCIKTGNAYPASFGERKENGSQQNNQEWQCTVIFKKIPYPFSYTYWEKE